MDKNLILEEILTIETKLIDVSKKVKNAEEFDSIESWVRHVLKNDHELAKHFVIPTDSRLRNALLNLITINSPLTQPVLNLLSTRIASYVAVIEDLKAHPMIGPAVNIILDNFQPLLALVHRHDFHFEQTKNIETIRQALEHNRLHVYQSYPKEPPIRVVLKTLQLDKSRLDIESLQYLLDFLFDQLKKNLEQPGFISQPRHAWWAYLDLLEESEAEWLQTKREDLNEILSMFLRAIEYIPKEADSSSVVPEMNSPFNEEVWVTINMMRVYRTCIHELLPHETVQALANRIDLNLRRIKEAKDDSIRSNQCKLLVLYEAIAYFNYVEILKLESEEFIDIRDRFIGQYLYNDDTVGIFRSMKATIHTLIANRQNWTKHLLTSGLVSGPPASGKSELIRQITCEIEKIADGAGKRFNQLFFTIGSEITTPEDLKAIMSDIESSSADANLVRVIAFDEFEKAGFNFLAPFLKILAAETKKEDSMTFWLFGQSSYPTFRILKSYAESLQDKTLRDFLTRLELGKIDLPELKMAPQQTILTLLGLAIKKDPQLADISRTCIRYFASNQEIRNNRQLVSVFEREALVQDNRLVLQNNNKSTVRQIPRSKNEWVKIII